MDVRLYAEDVDAMHKAFKVPWQQPSMQFAPSYRAEMTPAANIMSFTADKHGVNGYWSLFPVHY